MTAEEPIEHEPRTGGTHAIAGTNGAAAVAQPPRVRPDYRGAQTRPVRDSRRAATFVLVRVTGLMLTILVLGHFALTHIVTDVAETDAAFVARRWDSALWVTWDWLMLAAALLHGAAGVSVAIDDYAADDARRRRLRRILFGLSAAALTVGTITILTVIPA